MTTVPSIGGRGLANRQVKRHAVEWSLRKGLARFLLAYRIYRERRALMMLSDRSLKDLGLSRSQAFEEASRPIYDIPARRERDHDWW